jgi:selenium metabolism protein YedF
MTLLYLHSDQMGVGDPALGKKLLKSFLSELAKSDVKLDIVGCVNSEINLITEGSEVLESFKALETKGARIASCDTCLDHYHKRDKLLIGEISTMDMTVAVMSSANKVIRPC